MTDFPDLSTYNTSEKIQCLECKKYFFVINLGHLSKHSMTPESYKDKYRIPYMYALAGLKFRNTASERAIRNIDNIYKAKSMSDGKKKRSVRPCSEFKKRMLQERIVYASTFKDEDSYKRGAEKYKKLSKEDELFIIQNSDKYSHTCFCKMFGVSGSVIHKIKKENNLTFPRKPVARDYKGKFNSSIKLLIKKEKS